MKIRLFNARLISFANGDTRVQENMQVGIEDGKVAWYALHNRNWLVETNPHLP